MEKLYPCTRHVTPREGSFTSFIIHKRKILKTLAKITRLQPSALELVSKGGQSEVTQDQHVNLFHLATQLH